MRRRSVLASIMLAYAGMATYASPALANPPGISGSGTGGEPAGDQSVGALTDEQIASRAVKDRLISNISNRSTGGVSTMSCPTPNRGQTLGAESTSSCSGYPGKFVLGVHARQQERGDYCGPAVAQVISNYSWRMAANANKFTQRHIADKWALTSQIDCTGDGWIDGGTCLGRQVIAMNNATRRPANFAYIVKTNPSFANWHNTIISGVADWHLPLAASVRPWNLANTLRLMSWTKKSHGGHYITLHGYQGFATSAVRDVYYSDSAGVAASGMAAGNYRQSSAVVWRLMLDNNKHMIY